MAKDMHTLPEGTHTIALGVGDLNGLLRGKRIPAEQWPRVSASDNALSIAMFACDMTSDVWDTPYVNMDNGYPDMHIFPGGAVHAVPWEEGCAFCFGRALGTDHEPVPIDPRGALEAQVARAESMGYRAAGGAELEFYLLDPETLTPVDSGNQFYGLARAAELEHVIGPIRRQLGDVGIPIEQSNPEYAAGQVEVTCAPVDARPTSPWPKSRRCRTGPATRDPCSISPGRLRPRSLRCRAIGTTWCGDSRASSPIWYRRETSFTAASRTAAAWSRSRRSSWEGRRRPPADRSCRSAPSPCPNGTPSGP